MSEAPIWTNHIDEQEAKPIRILKDSNEQRIAQVIKSAIKNKAKVRAVGSGHSWSDICLTSGLMYEPRNPKGLKRFDKTVLNPTTDSKYLVRINADMRIRELNKALRKKKLGLSNMGGYDEQTFAGASATSTHGSGITHGPLSDMIVSLHIVASPGKVYRIEPDDGITDKKKFKAKYPDVKLIQSDDWFYAVIVAMGCLGVITSMIIKVSDFRNMIELRQLTNWIKAKKQLISDDILKKQEHFELLVNPYKTKAKGKLQRTTVLTIRNKYNGDIKNVDAKHRNRDFWTELGSTVVSRTKLYKLFLKNMKKSPKNIDGILKRMADKTYVSKSYNVYNIGNANKIPSYSSEIALPMKNNIYIKALEQLFKVVEKLASDENLYLSGTMAIRFVKASKAYLSPMYGRNTCMVEIIMLKNNPSAHSIYRRLEEAMIPFGARMHWGQYNFLTRDRIKKNYSKLSRWKKVASELNKDGTFNNQFSDRVGLSI